MSPGLLWPIRATITLTWYVLTNQRHLVQSGTRPPLSSRVSGGFAPKWFRTQHVRPQTLVVSPHHFSLHTHASHAKVEVANFVIGIYQAREFQTIPVNCAILGVYQAKEFPKRRFEITLWLFLRRVVLLTLFLRRWENSTTILQGCRKNTHIVFR